MSSPLTPETFHNIINGAPRVPSPSAAQSWSFDPRTEAPLWRVPTATAAELDEAVAAGNAAFATWRHSTTAERQDRIRAVAGVIREHRQELVGILMRETGKSRLMAGIEVDRTVEHYEYYTTVALEDSIQHDDASVRIILTHTPLGLVGAISPWNFPLILSSIKVASALATGNCVLIKPSPDSPYTMMRVCALAQSVLPPGVFQTLAGGAELGALMTKHPGIAHLSFTGTTAVGRQIAASCAARLKRTVLELAGNDAAIVDADVDLKGVVPKVAQGCWFHAGQMCVAAKRVYVHASRYDEFLALFREEARKKYRPQADPETPSVFGPLSNRANYERCLGFVADCRAQKYDLVAGLGVDFQAADLPEKGFWVPPTIVSRPPDDARVVREEQFGPVIPVMSWEDEEELAGRVNLPNAGLGASVYCRDPERARGLARRLECGTVWINTPGIPHPGGLFGGQKESGAGAGELGREGLKSYCNLVSLQIAKE